MTKSKKPAQDQGKANIPAEPKAKKTKLKHGPSESVPAEQPKPDPKPDPKPEPKKEAAPVNKVKGLSRNMLETLNAMKAGKPMTHAQIAAVTKREKGNKLRELTSDGLVTTGQEEGVRGYVYTITKQGLAAIKTK